MVNNKLNQQNFSKTKRNSLQFTQFRLRMTYALYRKVAYPVVLDVLKKTQSKHIESNMYLL
jgi:hypothetical protein